MTTLEEKLKRRLREWSNMARAYREAERECDEREVAARADDDSKRAKEEAWEAELNQAWAEALERCVADAREDLAAA